MFCLMKFSWLLIFVFRENEALNNAIQNTEGNQQNLFGQGNSVIKLTATNETIDTHPSQQSNGYEMDDRPVFSFDLSGHTSHALNTQPPTSQAQMDVAELELKSGIINFNGWESFNFRWKIWFFRAARSEILDLSFVLEKNSLGRDANLTLWEVGTTAKHVYNGFQSNWNEQKNYEFLTLFVVLLSVKESPKELSSFQLKYSVTRRQISVPSWAVLMIEDGLHSLSYPPNNSVNYQLLEHYKAVIAPRNKNQFRLSLKYLDVPGIPPSCENSVFGVWLLEENPTEAKFVYQHTFSKCGRRGEISEIIGLSKVALVSFVPKYDAKQTGRGFRLAVETHHQSNAVALSHATFLLIISFLFITAS